MRRSSNLSKLMLATVLLALSACSGLPKQPSPGDPEFAPVIGEAYKKSQPTMGAIYSEKLGGGTRALSLYSDKRAHRIGDIITVTLTERTTSSKTAETQITKDNEISLDESTLLGRPVSLLNGNYSLATTVNNERDFEGEADSSQSNSLQGSIAVTVADVTPNGLLVVRGEKWMTLNSGKEFIRVSGLLRPEDVAPDNSVASNRLADAEITYSGTGDFAESNRQGWLSRFFTSRWWPF